MPKKTRQRKIIFPAIFPEIKRIQSLPLRRGVLQVWELAVQESVARDLFPVPFKPEVKGTSLVEHIQFVVKASLLIADQLKKAHGYKIDLDLLIASALLHNVGKVFEYRRQDGRFKKAAIGNFPPMAFGARSWLCGKGSPGTRLTWSPVIPTSPPFPRSFRRESFSTMPILISSGSARGWRPFWKEGRNRMGQGSRVMGQRARDRGSSNEKG